MQNNFIQFSRWEDFYSIRDDIAKKKGKYMLEIEVFTQKTMAEKVFFYVEEKLYELLFELEHTVFLGKKIEKNKYKYFFLAKKQEKLEESVHYAMNEFPELSYAVFVEKFSKKYIEQFTPTMLEKQESKNLENLAELDQKLLKKEQKVVFFISYKETDISTFFTQSVKSLGFTIETIGKSPREDLPKALKLSKTFFLDAYHITQETNTLLTLCWEYHFLFEGWICKSN